MKVRGISVIAGLLVSSFVLLDFHQIARADESSATQPTEQVKTGELDLTFSTRNPLSTPTELGRRLNLKSTETKSDYDLTKIIFKTYVPANYDSATPVGVFVYLGYKDSPSIPPLWKQTLDNNHLIFITPAAHTGDHYPNALPRWQTLGLALDAVFNLKKNYAIDPHRLYLMSWNDGSMQISFASADVFTGFLVTYDSGFCQKLTLPDGRFYTPTFGRPGEPLWSRAKDRGYCLIADSDSADTKLDSLKVGALKRDGFSHLMSMRLSPGNDLHYPMFKAEWFSDQALPFLDKAAGGGKESAVGQSAIAQGNAAPTTQTTPAVSASPSEHLLSLAKLYISNGQPEMARKKLQELLDDYPGSPEAGDAKNLMSQLDAK